MSAQIFLAPDWPAPQGVGAVFTMRGLVADSPEERGAFDSFNLSDKLGDEPLAVARNRADLARYTGAKMVYLNQVHGCLCVSLDRNSPDGISADACVTDQVRLACTILVADCLPVLLTNDRGSKVAAVHCGWKGLSGGVLEQALAAFEDPRGNMLAWLGPCIGAQSFEVGPEVNEAFVQGRPQAHECIEPRPNGKFMANLCALARQRLSSAGVQRVFGNDGSTRWCTVVNSENYFSYRRETRLGKPTGRMAACIWKRE